MADTATTVHKITTHLFGDALARDLSFGSSCISIIPRAVSARELDAALGQVAEVSTPRAPEELHSCYRIQDDSLCPPKPYGGADWVYSNQMEEAEQGERLWVDNEPSYDSDATLPVEGEYAYATEARTTTISCARRPRLPRLLPRR
jgi:hypothetical protein